MSELLIKNAKLRYSNHLTDILIKDGKFEKIGAVSEVPQNTETIDAAGNIVTPPVVDPHVHLDAVLVSGLLKRKNETGTLLEAIDMERLEKRSDKNAQGKRKKSHRLVYS
ncbi:MAG: hypothetical protein ACLT3E_06860 [Anaerovoracaceae bacterium]